MPTVKLTLVRTRVGRTPKNVDVQTVREMVQEWQRDPTAGQSDGNVYTDRTTAQKIGSAYKTYIEKHFDLKVSAITAELPDEYRGDFGVEDQDTARYFVFSINPDAVETAAPATAQDATVVEAHEEAQEEETA